MFILEKALTNESQTQNISMILIRTGIDYFSDDDTTCNKKIGNLYD